MSDPLGHMKVIETPSTVLETESCLQTSDYSNSHCDQTPVRFTHPDGAFVRSTDAPLRVDTQRALGLVLGHGTHSWSLVRTRYMAGEVTHCGQGDRPRRIRCLTASTF